jgi:hypothetical protein
VVFSSHGEPIGTRKLASHASTHASISRGRVDQKRRSLLPVISAGSMHASSVHARGARCRYAAACAASVTRAALLWTLELWSSRSLGSLVEHALIFNLVLLSMNKSLLMLNGVANQSITGKKPG